MACVLLSFLATPSTRNVYFIKKNDDGVWVSGTIISDGSAFIISMAEDSNVREWHKRARSSLAREAWLSIHTIDCGKEGLRVPHPCALCHRLCLFTVYFRRKNRS